MDDLDTLLGIPLIWLPSTEKGEIKAQVQEMLQRSQLVADFLEGKATLEDYLDCLNDQSIDVDSCVNDWLDGVSYIQ